MTTSDKVKEEISEGVVAMSRQIIVAELAGPFGEGKSSEQRRAYMKRRFDEMAGFREAMAKVMFGLASDVACEMLSVGSAALELVGHTVH